MKLNDFRGILRDHVRLPEPQDAGFVERAKGLVPVPDPAPRRKPFAARFAALSGAFALVLTAFVFLVLGTLPAATVTLDINPSVRLELNRFGYVLQVEGTNEDGLLLVAELDKTRGSLPKVLSGILDSAVALGYATEDSADLLFGISGTSYESEQSLETKILSLLPAGSAQTLFLNLHTDTDLRDGLVTEAQADFWSVFGFAFLEYEGSVTTTSTVYAPSDYYTTEIPEWSMEDDDKFYTVVPGADIQTGAVTDGSGNGSKPVYSNLSPDQFSALAESLGVSEAKLNLAILVFQGYPTYILPSDLAFLASLSVGELMDLYAALP